MHFKMKTLPQIDTTLTVLARCDTHLGREAVCQISQICLECLHCCILASCRHDVSLHVRVTVTVEGQPQPHLEPQP